MKLILFVGHHKVGSSALQRWLARNAVALLRRGILYPAVEPEGLCTLLAMALGEGGGEGGGGGGGGDRAARIRAGDLPVNLREAHNALAFGMIAERRGTEVPALHQGLPPADHMLTAVRRQIEVFEPQVTILAAEVFANFGPVPVLIQKLLAAFPGADITLVATLRRIDDYLAAWHGQRLRFGHVLPPLPEALADYAKGIHFDYRRMLENWLRATEGAGRVIRPYDRVLAAGGSVRDFLAETGIAPPPGASLDEEVNRGLHRGVLELARRGNADLAPEDARAFFAALLRLGPGLGLPASSEVELWGAAARADLAQRFAPVHDWLSAVTGGAPFFADAARIGRTLPHPEAEVNRAALAALARHRGELPPAARALLQGIEIAPNFA